MLHIDNFFNVLYSEVGKVLCGALRYSALRGLVQMVLYIVVKIAVTFYRRGDVYYLKMWLCHCYQNAHCIVLNESFHLWINLTSSILTKPAPAPTPRFTPPQPHKKGIAFRSKFDYHNILLTRQNNV